MTAPPHLRPSARSRGLCASWAGAGRTPGGAARSLSREEDEGGAPGSKPLPTGRARLSLPAQRQEGQRADPSVPTTGRHEPLGPHGREVWPGSARRGAQGTSAGPGPPSFHPPDAQAQHQDPVVISPPTPPRQGSEPAPSPLHHPQAGLPSAPTQSQPAPHCRSAASEQINPSSVHLSPAA